MKPRNAKILCILIFIIMVVPTFVSNIPSIQKTVAIELDSYPIKEDETFVNPQAQDHRTKAESGNGTIFNNAMPTDIINMSGYYTIGVTFEVNQDCLIYELGIFYSSWYNDVYNIRLWEGNFLKYQKNYPLHLGYDKWGWYNTSAPISLYPGNTYTISAYLNSTGFIPLIKNPGPTPDGVVDPGDFVWSKTNSRPTINNGSSPLPMVDLKYSFMVYPSPDIIVPDDYTTIQEAIDAANPGDEIYVRENPIPYNEELIINKTVTLVGQDMYTTIINASGIVDGSGTVIHITANDVLIQGFTVTGGDCGIYCDNTNWTKIGYCTISKNNDYGIYMDTTNNDIIESNIISNNNLDSDSEGFGIYALDSSAKGVWGNTISYNEVGVKIIDSWLWACLNWNTFVGNNIAVDYDPEPLEIDSNVFIDNTIAIKISGDDSLLIITNNSISGSEIGIFIETGSPVIEGNIFTDNEYGIYYLGGSTPIISNNTFSNNVIDIYSIILADLDVDPDTLNLKSNGRWVTAYIILPEGMDASDIDFDTISLGDGTFEVGGEYGEFNSNVCMAKFDRSELEDQIGSPNEALELIVTGELKDGTPLRGSDTIRVICPGR
ncbi:MAG: right-handed parallel beta-helix repeat-containing protein [Thermoplasmata archaeon]|nr:MAG: right-handed parallel beta-helix repeat-containing protein [Thermoplasmata archaeon]